MGGLGLLTSPPKCTNKSRMRSQRLGPKGQIVQSLIIAKYQLLENKLQRKTVAKDVQKHIVSPTTNIDQCAHHAAVNNTKRSQLGMFYQAIIIEYSRAPHRACKL